MVGRVTKSMSQHLTILVKLVVAIACSFAVAACEKTVDGEKQRSSHADMFFDVVGKDVARVEKILTIPFNRALYVLRETSRQSQDDLELVRTSVRNAQEYKLSTTTVNSASELVAALKAASDGDTILLAAGSYGKVDISNIKFADGVSIASKDPTNQAVISTLNVTGSQGLNFSNIEFSTEGSTKMGGLFSVVNSKDIEFKNVYVHGTLDGNPQNDVDGFRLLNSQNVKIIDSEFEQLRIAIGHRDSDGMVISGNHIHDIRMDGVRGSGSSNVNISNNYFRDFYRVDGDHADAIQYYTGSTTTPAHDITISNNIIERGDGLAMQGVFLRDENGGLSYQGVTITGNIMVGTNYNGIAVLGGQDVKIAGNTVLSEAGSASWIRLKDVDGAIVSDNLVRDDNSNQYLFANVTGLKEIGNKVGGSVSDGGQALIQQWLNSHDYSAARFGEELDFKGGVTVPDGGVTGERPPLTESPSVEIPGAEEPHALVLESGGGNDLLLGGEGVDTVSYSSVGSAVRVDLKVGTIQNTLGGGKDTLVGIQNLSGSDWNDTLTGNEGNNVLSGGAGNDKLVGGLGADTLIGGAGADSFHISDISHSTVDPAGRDVILDFNRAEGDRIIVRDIDAISGGVDDPFKFVAKFTGVAGQLISVAEDDHYVVMGDVNGDGIADFAVTVFSTTPLERGDFLI